MTRNLAFCVVPTVIALLAVYWYRKKKRIKPKDNAKDPSDVFKSEYTGHDLAADNTSDSANTLSDASSFASPVSSEKSLRTSSPSYTSPLHNSTENNIHTVEKLSNYINENNITDLSFSLKDGDFNKLNNLHRDISNITDPNCELLELSNSNWDPLSFENIETEAFDKMTQLESLNNIDCHEKSVNISSAIKRNNCLKQENRNSENSYNYDDIILQDVVDNKEHHHNLNDYSIFAALKECKKSIENDNHSSVFDENSLSYVSDDSEYKHLTECKNKDSLSSVLDENSLMSSFCDELEKSSNSNSPSAKPDHYDSEHSMSPKETVSFMPSKDLNLLLSPEFAEIELNSCNLAEDNHNKEEKCKLVTKADTKLLNNFLDFKTIKSSANEPCDETDCDSMAGGDTVQNIFSKMDKSVFMPLKNDSTCDNLVSAVNLKCSLQSKCSSSPESDSSAANPNSLFVNTVCNTESHLNCSVKTSSETSSDDHILTSDVTSNGKAENHLEAAADVVHRISSDLSTSFSALLTNNTAFSSPNFKSNLKWSPSLSKKESTSKSFTSNSTNANTDSKPTCDTDDSSLSKESVCSEETVTSNVHEESKVLNTDNTSLPVNNNEENQNLLCSSSSVMNENLLKVTKSSKKESNGINEIKASQPVSEYVYEFELAQELCGRLIGKHGKHVKSIIERSNANVFIKRHPYDPQLKVVVVEGDRSDVKEALDMIRRKYPPSQFPNVTLVQTNVINTSGVPMPDSLQLHLPEGASCDVILSSLVSAGHFFLQQPTHPTYPSLSTLDQCMIGLYSQMDTPLLPQPIEAGVICAAPVYRGWYRAQVIYVCENETDCGIKFVDYGGFSQVNISSLRQIRSDFMSLPFQASECYLAHVRPIAGDTWPAEATSIFEELAQGQILQALLVEYAEDGIPCVYLYRVQGITTTFINKELVERGLAVWVNSNHWDPH